MSKAYLVGFIDTDSGEMLGTGIFSESAPTNVGPRFNFLIWQESGSDFPDACKNLRESMKKYPKLRWARRHLQGKI